MFFCIKILLLFLVLKLEDQDLGFSSIKGDENIVK